MMMVNNSAIIDIHVSTAQLDKPCPGASCFNYSLSQCIVIYCSVPVELLVAILWIKYGLVPVKGVQEFGQTLTGIALVLLLSGTRSTLITEQPFCVMFNEFNGVRAVDRANEAME